MNTTAPNARNPMIHVLVSGTATGAAGTAGAKEVSRMLSPPPVCRVKIDDPVGVSILEPFENKLKSPTVVGNAAAPQRPPGVV